MEGAPLRIGLTGGIGSGKSSVAERLQRLGAALIDTDAISRELTAAGGAAIPALGRRFGPGCLTADGALDRGRMRERAFGDTSVRAALEAILHPLIGEETERRAAQATDRPAIVFDVPLLVESDRWRQRVDRVLVVDCPPQLQIERVMRRSGWTRDAVERVIAQQAERKTRLAAADAVLDNGGADLTLLDAAIEPLWRHWTGTPH